MRNFRHFQTRKRALNQWEPQTDLHLKLLPLERFVGTAIAGSEDAPFGLSAGVLPRPASSFLALHTDNPETDFKEDLQGHRHEHRVMTRGSEDRTRMKLMTIT